MIQYTWKLNYGMSVGQVCKCRIAVEWDESVHVKDRVHNLLGFEVKCDYHKDKTEQETFDEMIAFVIPIYIQGWRPALDKCKCQIFQWEDVIDIQRRQELSITSHRSSAADHDWKQERTTTICPEHAHATDNEHANQICYSECEAVKAFSEAVKDVEGTHEYSFDKDQVDENGVRKLIYTMPDVSQADQDKITQALIADPLITNYEIK